MKKFVLNSFFILFFLCFFISPLYAWNFYNPMNPWQPPVSYWVDVDLDGPVTEVIEDAAIEWSAVAGANFYFQFNGETDDNNFLTKNGQTTIMSIDNGAPDWSGNNVCVRFPNGTGVLGFTLSFSKEEDGETYSIDGNIVICINQVDEDDIYYPIQWFVGGGDQVPGESEYDFGSVITHEMGHLARLDHSCDNTINNGIVDCDTLSSDDIRVTATMQYSVKSESVDERTINEDDISGLQALYGVMSSDLDKDKDGVPNDEDNCPNKANWDQEDTNDNGIGYACDPSENWILHVILLCKKGELTISGRYELEDLMVDTKFNSLIELK